MTEPRIAEQTSGVARPGAVRMPPTRLRRAAASALAATAALAAGCSGPPPAATFARVTVHNPTGDPLWLHEAARDGWRPPRPLGARATHRLHLAVGRYALGRSPQRALVPLPILPRELGYEPAPLEVTVQAPPPPEPGWCWIPAGPFVLGDRLGVGQEDERPVRTPSSGGFWLSSHETTNADYARFLSAIPGEEVDPGWLDFGGSKCRVIRDEATGDYGTDAPRMPVVTVSAAGAEAYCRWRTATTGLRHRLPTEAEWEKAARGPGSRVYAYGDTCATLRANQESGALAPVGGYEPNGFGLFDMTGNAFEWTADDYVSGRAGDPDAGKFRALRGGSFLLDGIFVRNAMRMRLRPTVRADDVGFRVLREAPRRSL